MRQFNYRIFADYFQFYLEDESAELDVSYNIWAGESLDRLLAVQPGILAVGTVRNMTVPVTLEIVDDAPDGDFSAWDHVNECSFEMKSGKLNVSGCTDRGGGVDVIDLAPGIYRARIYYGGLFTVDEIRVEGDDHYKIVFWLAPKDELKVLKRSAPTYS